MACDKEKGPIIQEVKRAVNETQASRLHIHGHFLFFVYANADALREDEWQLQLCLHVR